MRTSLDDPEYRALLALQDGGCAICRGQGDRLHAIDHDSTLGCCPGRRRPSCTDCIRGLLCERCNRAIGAFDHDPELLERAAAYLRRPPAGRRLGPLR